MNNSTSPELEIMMQKWQMSLVPRIIWDFLFGSMIFVAVVGNLIVLWIVAAHRYMRTIPNAFIVNMSLSDLLMAVLNCSFNFVTMRDRKWEFGQVYCSINNFMAIVTVAASVLNLTAMSLDRYKAVVWPLKMRTSKYVVAAVILAIWIGSGLFALPAILFSTTLTVLPGQEICYIKWPDESEDLLGASFQDYIYNIIILLVTFVFPIIIIGFCTIHMTLVLWCRQPVCIITPQLERAKRKKQKIVRMLVVLIVIFGACWLPYHVYFIYSYHFPDVRRLPYIQHIFLAFYWCAMAHAMVNPLVYYFMNPKFRHYYRHILMLKCLKPSPRNAPTGLILASAFGLQVAAHLAYSEANAKEGLKESSAANTPCRRLMRKNTQMSTLNSPVRHHNKKEENDPVSREQHLTVINHEPQQGDHFICGLAPMQDTISRRFSTALTLALKNESPGNRASFLVALQSHEDFIMAEDLLEIGDDDNALVEAHRAAAASFISMKESSMFSQSSTECYRTGIFPKITRV